MVSGERYRKMSLAYSFFFSFSFRVFRIRKMFWYSLRMRFTYGSFSNMMECEISLKKSRTNLSMISTMDT